MDVAGRRVNSSKTDLFEFFPINTKLPMLSMLTSKDFKAAKNVTSSGARAEDHSANQALLASLGL